MFAASRDIIIFHNLPPQRGPRSQAPHDHLPIQILILRHLAIALGPHRKLPHYSGTNDNSELQMRQTPAISNPNPRAEHHG